MSYADRCNADATLAHRRFGNEGYAFWSRERRFEGKLHLATSHCIYCFGYIVDILTRERRSELMGRIRGKDTGPELRVRRFAHGMGYRFRLHRRDLPGSPDVVFPSRKAAIFIHGCFWHRHTCGRAYEPKTRPEFWSKKFAGNVARDRQAKRALRKAGWKVLVIWECETTSGERVTSKLLKFLGSPRLS